MVADWVGQCGRAIGIFACAATFACGHATSVETASSIAAGGSGGSAEVDAVAGRTTASESPIIAGGAPAVVGAAGGSAKPAEDRWPHCPGVEPVSLAAAESASWSAVTVDEKAVYFTAPGGMISRITKNGGELRALQRADATGQLAVDANNVYIPGYTFWSVPKDGGDLRRIILNNTALGVVSVNSGVYFTNWGVSQTSLQRWSSEGGIEEIERFNSELNASFLVTDSEYIYVAAMATAPVGEVHRVRLSDGTVEPLAMVQIVRGIAVGGGYLYFSEETTRSVKRIRLSDQVIENVRTFDDYPTGLAVDQDYVYLSLQVLPKGEHVYDGHLVRFRADGSELCELAAPANYGSSLVVDSSGLYWLGGGGLWKLAAGSGTPP